MIGYVKGTVERIFASSVFIDVHGVGYRVYAPVSTLAHLNVGEESLLYTYMNVREDAIVLYGFLTQDEYDLFMLLIGVNGVGPKVANGILSATGTDSFRAAVANKDIGLLTKMPGIGKKTAERIVLELQDKVGTPVSSGESEKTPDPSPIEGIGAEVAAALAGLGYSEREIEPIIAREAKEHDSVESLLKACLRALGTGR